MGHSQVALEMITFFNIPSVTLSYPKLLNVNVRKNHVAINPRFEVSLKSLITIFHVLQWNWKKVTVLHSTHPAYTEITKSFKNYIDTANGNNETIGNFQICDAPNKSKADFLLVIKIYVNTI